MNNWSRSKLSIESLEARQLLSADGVSPSSDVSIDAQVAAESPDILSEDTGGFATYESFAQYRQWAIDAQVERYRTWYGRKAFSWHHSDQLFHLHGNTIAMGADQTTFASTAYSTDSTNVQVTGVDEADIVETDGEFIYVVRGQTLSIVDARDRDSLSVVSRLDLAGTADSMFLHNGRLTVLTNQIDSDLWNDVFLIADSSYSIANPTLTATVIDVSDVSNPTVLERVEFEGWLVDARAVNDQVHLVIQNSLSLPTPEMKAWKLEPIGPVMAGPFQPGLKTSLLSTSAQPSFGTLGTLAHRITPDFRAATHFYESEVEFRQRLESLPDSEFLPSYQSFDADGELRSEGFNADISSTYMPIGHDDFAQLSIVTIDMSQDDNVLVAAATLTGIRPEGIYATADSIYLYQGHFEPHANIASEWWVPIWNPQSAQSKIVKIDMTADHPTPSASGVVDGTINSQFMLDEYDGYLRVVSSSRWGGWGDNELTILRQEGNELTTVGHIDKIAPGEQVYSVRFMGSRAYVVTFRTVDPLFSIDLSNPEDPQIKGELKIPGFSDYLHPVGENHLIGIGRNADELSGLFSEIQISLFNVSDLENPLRVDYYSFEGGRSLTTDASFDHHAVQYHQETGILTVPVSQYPDRWWTQNSSPAQIGDAVFVFQIDVASGIEELGSIQHQDRVNRTLTLNDTLFSISISEIIASQIDDPGTQFSTINYLTSSVNPIETAEPIDPAAEQPESNSIENKQVEPISKFDLNGDGEVSSLDSDLIIAAINGFLDDDDHARFDINGDGVVSAIDALMVLQ